VTFHVRAICESVSETKDCVSESPKWESRKSATGRAIPLGMPRERLPERPFETSAPIQERPLQEKAAVLQGNATSIHEVVTMNLLQVGMARECTTFEGDK
jgi:hypothetical protein